MENTNTQPNTDGAVSQTAIIQAEALRREHLRVVLINMLVASCKEHQAQQLSNFFVVELFAAHYGESWTEAANVHFARVCKEAGLSCEELPNGDMLVRLANTSTVHTSRQVELQASL